MYSWEIKELMEMKKYLLEIEEYFRILETSPQINRIIYYDELDYFYIATDDKYEFNFKVKRKEM